MELPCHSFDEDFELPSPITTVSSHCSSMDGKNQRTEVEALLHSCNLGGKLGGPIGLIAFLYVCCRGCCFMDLCFGWAKLSGDIIFEYKQPTNSGNLSYMMPRRHGVELALEGPACEGIGWNQRLRNLNLHLHGYSRQDLWFCFGSPKTLNVWKVLTFLIFLGALRTKHFSRHAETKSGKTKKVRWAVNNPPYLLYGWGLPYCSYIWIVVQQPTPTLERELFVCDFSPTAVVFLGEGGFMEVYIYDLWFMTIPSECFCSHGIRVWYIYIYMYHKNQPNVGKYRTWSLHEVNCNELMSIWKLGGSFSTCSIIKRLAAKRKNTPGCRFVPFYIFGNKPPQMVPMDLNTGETWVFTGVWRRFFQGQI